MKFKVYKEIKENNILCKIALNMLKHFCDCARKYLYKAIGINNKYLREDMPPFIALALPAQGYGHIRGCHEIKKSCEEIKRKQHPCAKSKVQKSAILLKNSFIVPPESTLKILREHDILHSHNYDCAGKRTHKTWPKFSKFEEKNKRKEYPCKKLHCKRKTFFVVLFKNTLINLHRLRLKI